MTINCKGDLIDLTTPRVMGILNLTPDSFYDGGQLKSTDQILKKVDKMLTDGATFIDIGAYSSRPGAQHIDEQEELKRILPTVKRVIAEFPNILLSIDTFRSSIAEKCIDAGACMVNDISGGNLDKNMFKTISKLQVPYVLMHMPGNPQNMNKLTDYEDVISDLIFYFSKKTFELRELGINDFIIDVGFGFGKTLDQNYTLLKNLSLFKTLNAPILAGLSRKSMLYKLLEKSPNEALNATTVANTISILNGANILRVHDVKEAIESIKIITKTYESV